MINQASHQFNKISDIVPEKSETYSSIFLTFDIDWAHDEIINDTIDIVEKVGVSATWFITHNTPVLSRLRANPKFELGIHPNFNSLLEGDLSNGNSIRSIIENLLGIVPEAKSLRSHSLVTNTKLLQMMPEYRLTHESNLYIDRHSLNNITPLRIWNNIIRVPHSFEDDLFLLTQNSFQLSFTSYMTNYINEDQYIRILDFHPIHIFLNTENIIRYESTRNIHHNPQELIKYRFSGEGTRTAFEILLGIH